MCIHGQVKMNQTFHCVNPKIAKDQWICPTTLNHIMNMNESYDQSTIVESSGNGCTEFVDEHLGTAQYCANAQKKLKIEK